MANLKTCDLCKEQAPAVDTVTVAGGKLTPRVVDLCEEHLAEFKKLMAEFFEEAKPS